MAEAQHEQLRQDRRQLLKLGCADVDVEAGEVVVYLKRLLSKAGQGSLKLAHLFTDGGCAGACAWHARRREDRPCNFVVRRAASAWQLG
jgi:hypothetical protein